MIPMVRIVAAEELRRQGYDAAEIEEMLDGAQVITRTDGHVDVTVREPVKPEDVSVRIVKARPRVSS